MNRYPKLVISALVTIGSLPALTARERLAFDADWRFHLGDATGAEAARFDDTAWRKIDLPHDWSIEGTPERSAVSEGAGGFLPTGLGWYRKTFRLPADWGDRSVVIEFDGVYRNGEVWINGTRLGAHPYGYTPFSFDLTPHLVREGENVLAVRVDNFTQPNSRWYSGSGIYRHVWLTSFHPVHVVPGQVFITTEEALTERARVGIAAAVRNDSSAPVTLTLDIECVDPRGRRVGGASVTTNLAAGGEASSQRQVTIERPRLWSPESPALHRAVLRVRDGNRLVDTWETTFGIRTVRVSPENGFEINGRSIELVGGNVHHDNGPIGAAAFDRAEERRVELLKEAGFNAIRTSHNPPSPAFLAACDRLGMLVLDEAFDGWAKAKMKHDYHETFDEWSLRDLETMVRRDRNHPSVVLWSIGNEVYERGNEDGRRIARTLAARVRDLDPTRPVTAGINGLGENGDWTQLDAFFDALDVAGYNYETVRHAADHARVPSRVIVTTESFQTDTFRYWAASVDEPYVIGDFVWTGLDYLGEAGIGRFTPPDVPATPHWESVLFPWHGAYCGDIDLTGWRKPVSHYRNIVWDRGEKLYAVVHIPTADGRPWNFDKWGMPPALPSWTWTGQEGKPLTLEVFSRHDTVRVSLNGRLVGEQPTTRAQEFKAKFEIPYAPGALEVAGVRGGKVIETRRLETTGPATKLRLTPDRATIRADRQDLSFVVVEVTDASARKCYDANHAVTYAIDGPGEIAGIASGDLTTLESYQANPRRAWRGRALVVIRSTTKSGAITLKANAAGLEDGSVRIQSR